VREHCLQEQLEVAAPMSEEDELRLDEMGEDEWVAEKVRERLRGELPDQSNKKKGRRAFLSYCGRRNGE
jgi:hypothetical protein